MIAVFIEIIIFSISFEHDNIQLIIIEMYFCSLKK